MTGFDHPEELPRTLGAVTVLLTAAAGALDVGGPRPAVLTLIGPDGGQVDRAHTRQDGTFRLQPPESGEFVLVCSPHRMGGRAARPRAVTVTVDGHPVVHDVVLAPAAAGPGTPRGH